MGGGGFSAVLFDWRGTLFHDESDRDWILASAAAIGREMAENEADRLAQPLADADDHPQVQQARQQADCSPALHRAAALLQLRLAGFDPDLALAVWQRDGNPLASFPYPDTAPVLRTLKARGVRVGIISDIHYDLRPMFEYHGLADLVDAFTLAFQHGWAEARSAPVRGRAGRAGRARDGHAHGRRPPEPRCWRTRGRHRNSAAAARAEWRQARPGKRGAAGAYARR
jgi:phosphoglycolate phosphatase-like HAD superfamily hydrolase